MTATWETCLVRTLLEREFDRREEILTAIVHSGTFEKIGFHLGL
jgi:hypothetical protein